MNSDRLRRLARRGPPAAALALLLVLPACSGGGGGGAGGSGVAALSSGSGEIGVVSGSLGLFEINSHTYHVDQFGRLVTKGFVAGLDYSGPAGCAGRIFDVSGRTVIFRYTAHNAEMQDGDSIFYFSTPPRVLDGTLAWHGKFFGAGENDDVTAIVSCPMPAASIAPIPQSGS